jgi:hypothetical protein
MFAYPVGRTKLPEKKSDRKNATASWHLRRYRLKRRKTKMKATKWIVGGGALLGIASVFMSWISVDGKANKLLDALPKTGMENGGPVFIVLLSLPLIAAVVGAAKRFGRGMAGLALAGGLLSAFMGLVKYADIESAGKIAKGIATVSAAPGYWLFFIGSVVAMVGGIIGLIKPEKAEEAKGAGAMAPARV